jgi:hypothetical protein
MRVGLPPPPPAFLSAITALRNAEAAFGMDPKNFKLTHLRRPHSLLPAFLKDPACFHVLPLPT